MIHSFRDLKTGFSLLPQNLVGNHSATPFVWETPSDAAHTACIGHVGSHTFRHYADIRTTMNLYWDAATEDMRNAQKVVRLAVPKAM
jgi:hypothetical protein